MSHWSHEAIISCDILYIYIRMMWNGFICFRVIRRVFKLNTLASNPIFLFYSFPIGLYTKTNTQKWEMWIEPDSNRIQQTSIISKCVGERISRDLEYLPSLTAFFGLYPKTSFNFGILRVFFWKFPKRKLALIQLEYL